MDAEKLIHFLIEAGKLKKIKRTGWLLRGVKNPESVADHTFRMALMAWIFARSKGLNYERVIKMALIHDLCEVKLGDITPYDSLLPNGVKDRKRKQILRKWPRWTKEKKGEMRSDKLRKESESLERVLKGLPLPLKKEIKNLWLEYIWGQSAEAKFLRQADKIENLIQALEYEKSDKDFPVGPFWVEVKELVDDPDLIEFMKALEKHFYKKK